MHRNPEPSATSRPPLEIVIPARAAAAPPTPVTHAARLADLAGVFTLPLAGLGVVVLIHYGLGTSVARLTRDPLATANLSPLTGLLSSLGVLVWAATVTVCLFGARIHRDRPQRAEERGFFLGFGVLSAVLLVDDLFRIHDYYADMIGITEHMLFALYGATALALLIRYQRFIRSASWSLLAIAFVCFATSIVVDAEVFTLPFGHHLVEDGSKWLGICAWCAYFSRRVFETLTSPSR